MYNVEWIYFLLPIACLFVMPFYRQDKKMICTIIILSFTVIYAFCLNGADLKGYAALYRLSATKTNFDAVHGEIGFKALMFVCNKLGISYLCFRVCLIMTCSLLFFYCAYKISPNFPLSVFLTLTLFTIYVISAYRQYIVMTIAVFWYYVYYEGKTKVARIIPFLGIALSAFFHKAALFPLALLVVYHFIHKKRLLQSAKEMMWIAFGSLVIRFLIYYVSQIGFVYSLLVRVTSYIDGDIALLSGGLLSRIAFLGVISYLYLTKQPKNPLTIMLFNIYFVGICIYICLPYELVMGRLVNTIHFMLVLLVPMLLFGEKEKLPLSSSQYVRGKSAILLDKAAFYGIICLSLFILIVQLLRQSGYTPYQNIMFGDKFQ